MSVQFYRFVPIPGVGLVDLNKWRVICRECDHEVMDRGDFCEHIAAGVSDE